MLDGMDARMTRMEEWQRFYDDRFTIMEGSVQQMANNITFMMERVANRS